MKKAFDTYFCKECGSEILRGKICDCHFSEEDEEEEQSYNETHQRSQTDIFMT